MRSITGLLLTVALLGCSGSAFAGECPGHPDALGTERILIVNPKEHPRIGTIQYRETLPLADKEIVLTFDDGPLPRYTDRILKALAAECVRATFFMVGGQAREYPAMVRRIYNEGHTVGSHSQNHPRLLTLLPLSAAEHEVDQGIRSVAEALGDPKARAPFFRLPGLGRSQAIETYLAERGIMTWSADIVADDWTHIPGQEVMHRALERLDQKGKGILLLHDIQPATALMLPELLRELKARGYQIVHVMPAGIDRPETVTEPQSWVMHRPGKSAWPAVLGPTTSDVKVPSAQSFGWPHPFRAELLASAAALISGTGKRDQDPAVGPSIDRGTLLNVMQPRAPISIFGVSEFGQFSAVTGSYYRDSPAVASDQTFSSMSPGSLLRTRIIRRHSGGPATKPHPRHPVGSSARLSKRLIAQVPEPSTTPIQSY